MRAKPITLLKPPRLTKVNWDAFAELLSYIAAGEPHYWRQRSMRTLRKAGMVVRGKAVMLKPYPYETRPPGGYWMRYLWRKTHVPTEQGLKAYAEWLDRPMPRPPPPKGTGIWALGRGDRKPGSDRGGRPSKKLPKMIAGEPDKPRGRPPKKMPDTKTDAKRPVKQHRPAHGDQPEAGKRMFGAKR
jgi:hypothetical protein